MYLQLESTPLMLILMVLVDASEDHDHHILCRRCGREICDPDYLSPAKIQTSPFDAAKRNLTKLFGKDQVPLQHLTNPAGVEFDLVLFKKSGCQGVGKWYSSGTWFPGYPWRFCVCPQCGHHLGWMYEPEDNLQEEEDGIYSESSLTDQGFYGLILDKLIDEAYASTLLSQGKQK